MNRRPCCAAMAAVVLVSALGACSGAPDSYAMASLDRLSPTTTTTTATPASSPQPTTSTTISESRRLCDELDLATASYPPGTPEVTPGSFMQQLRDTGRIRVGLDENTEGFSARNPATGQIEGFEVELAHEIAKRVFGDAYTPDVVKAVPLLTGEKTEFVAEERVDLTISATSMTCDRWESVDFSAEYYTAHQEFLVRSDSDIHDVADLAGTTVCVTVNSTSKTKLEKLAPEAEPLPLPARTDCLVALQRGEADAYFSHDSFLYGMKNQDPNLEIRAIFDPVDTVSHYGIVVNRQHRDFTRFVNGVLAGLIADGTWDRLAGEWLVAELRIDPPTPPAPDYRREP